MVGRWHGLEVLHAGRLDPPPMIGPAAVEALLYLARGQYDVVCADLASGVDPFSAALLRESKRIFLVATAEVVSLHMAGVRVNQLKELGFKDRVSLVINRVARNKPLSGEVADTIGLPVAHTVINDYAGVQTFILEGSPEALKGDLRKSIASLAQTLAPGGGGSSAAPKRKFLEFFHLPSLQEARAGLKE